MALAFFAFTGLLLNHPDWLSGKKPPPAKRSFSLATSEIAQLRESSEPARVLVHIGAETIALKGFDGNESVEGEFVGNELFVRMQGVRGTTFMTANLRSGAVDVTIESTSALAVLNELHRAERAGKSWRLVVDAVAVLLLMLSLVGYIIFLSMRGTRLRTAFALTLVSSLGLFLLYAYAVN